MTLHTSPESPNRLPIIWPAPLKPGDLLAVVAPASPVDPDLFTTGAAWLKKWGFRLSYGPEIFVPRPFRIEADLEVWRFLTQALANPEVRGIISARGGYGALRLLEHLDYGLLRADPKWIIGFSDITNLLCTMHQQGGIITFHGPTVAQLSELTEPAREQFYRLLTGDQIEVVCFRDLTVLWPGAARGPLIGGNLTTICHLLGTPFAPDLSESILFLEDHHEAPYRIDRMLQHLRLSGSLGRVRAVVLGSFTQCGNIQQLWDIFTAVGAALGIPILAGLPAGHQPDNFLLPIGAVAQVDSASAMVRLAIGSS